LATSIVDQSDSLFQVWKGVCNASHVAPGSRLLPDNDLLYMPDVIDLTWIKSSRQQLAFLLSHMLDHFCTIDVLHTLSEQLSPRSTLDESMWHARNAREHLLSYLLLGKKPVAKGLAEPNDKLLLSLLQYREHLDALSGAIWSCQHCIDDSESDEASARIEWWARVKHQGGNCRALENEISQRFFPPPDEDDLEQRAVRYTRLFASLYLLVEE
jgi:hypothetical protein